MLLTEYNEAEQMELFKEDGRREGILDTLVSLVRDGILSIKDAAARAGVSEDIIKKKTYNAINNATYKHPVNVNKYTNTNRNNCQYFFYNLKKKKDISSSLYLEHI